MAEFEFDVFLSHNSRDKEAVRKLKELLCEHGLKSWLDEDELRPGINTQPALEHGLRSSGSIAVLIGKDGLGPWEDEEMQAALKLAVKDRRPVIPVQLPGCKNPPDLPIFLVNRTWVDLSGGFSKDAIDRLVWGVVGKKPDLYSAQGQESKERDPATPAELWPIATGWQDKAGIPKCYQRLTKLCEAGSHPQSDERYRLWQGVKQHRPDSFLAWQLAGIARWSAPDYLEVEERFTPLHVTIRVRDKDQPAAEKQQITADNLEQAMDLVFEQHGTPATVLLAPPGGGKSTLLRHYHLQQARRLESCDRIVFYVQLRDYRPPEDAARPALDWLEVQWEKETQNAPSIEDCLGQRKLTLLLDGLNEIPREGPDDYARRIQEWRDLIVEVESHYVGVRLLFSCRPMDYSQRIDAGRELPLPELEILPMEPDRIQVFIDKKFQETPAVANQVWNQLREHPSFELYSSPYYLNLLLGRIDTNADEVTIPGNRAALFSGMVKARLCREIQNNPNSRLCRKELISEDDRRALYSGRFASCRLPEDTPFFEVLAGLAYHIQERANDNERWGKLRWKQAVAIANERFEDRSLAEECLFAACDLGLLEDDAAQTKVFRFIHQLVQEYFAAWVLARLGDASKVSGVWRAKEMKDSTEKLLAQGGDDDLPELPSTGWEESARMAVNLMDEPEPFVREMATHNLPLAGFCAAQPGVTISAECLEELRDRLRRRSVDSEADLRARIQAGKALGELGDPERLTEHTGRNGSKYLLPKFAVIEAGGYTIGGDPERFSNESAEPMRVSLKAFEIAMHPVTNAEFAVFVKDQGYHNDDYWPRRALQWRNGEIGEEATRQLVKNNIETVRDAVGKKATPEEIKENFPSLSIAYAKWFHERIHSNDEELETFLLQTYPPASGVPFVQPAFWRSQKWSNPAQPVVGVCWYEALAYCLWLNEISGNKSIYRLPSEAEWEAAARGKGEWRRNAWSGDFDPLKANTAETRLGVTTPVGIFSEGCAPRSGLQELSGNVLEWTASPLSEANAWAPMAKEKDGEDDARRVVRGGSWNNTRSEARLGARNHNTPENRNNNCGFRLCRASHISTRLLRMSRYGAARVRWHRKIPSRFQNDGPTTVWRCGAAV